MRVEARLKFGGDGEVGGEKSGRVHESPLLAIGRFARGGAALRLWPRDESNSERPHPLRAADQHALDGAGCRWTK